MMTSITDHYGIEQPVPFIDVDVTTDNRLYVDPHAIRKLSGSSTFAAAATRQTDSFFQLVTAAVIAGDPESLGRARALLQQFKEPRETRLGMARAGFYGHGGGEMVGDWILDALTGDIEALVRVGALRHLEDLPLFVEGVDRDITSDVTTRIVFGSLAQFTAHVLSDFPEFDRGPRKSRTVRCQFWDAESQCWTTENYRLPYVDDEPLLLVPVGWARRSLLMSATRFYETTVLGFAQAEKAVRGSDGRMLLTPKRVLRLHPGLGRGRATNLAVTQRAIRTEHDLIAAFKDFVASRWTAPEETDGRVA